MVVPFHLCTEWSLVTDGRQPPDEEILTQSYQPPACDLWSFGVVVCLGNKSSGMGQRRKYDHVVPNALPENLWENPLPSPHDIIWYLKSRLKTYSWWKCAHLSWLSRFAKFWSINTCPVTNLRVSRPGHGSGPDDWMDIQKSIIYGTFCAFSKMCWRFLMLSGISPFESWPKNKRVGTWMMICELDDRNSQSNLAGWISNFSTSSHFCLRMPKQPSRWPRMCGKSISPSAHLRAETAPLQCWELVWICWKCQIQWIQWCNIWVK